MAEAFFNAHIKDTDTRRDQWDQSSVRVQVNAVEEKEMLKDAVEAQAPWDVCSLRSSTW